MAGLCCLLPAALMVMSPVQRLPYGVVLTRVEQAEPTLPYPALDDPAQVTGWWPRLPYRRLPVDTAIADPD